MIKGVMWVGEPDLGKTPAVNTKATLMSAFWRQRDGIEGDPCFRTNPGRKVVPPIVDYGSTNTVGINHLDAHRLLHPLSHKFIPSGASPVRVVESNMTTYGSQYSRR
eukprot:4935403-Amphidinium_carterae.1